MREVTLDVVTLVPRKDALRRGVWDALQKAHVARFPGAWGRIPNFVGAEAAAGRARGLDVCNGRASSSATPTPPNSHSAERLCRTAKSSTWPSPVCAPQSVSSRSILRASVRPRYGAPPASLALRYTGAPVHPRDMPAVDLVVTGVVAAGRDGSRLGKGGGYSDLEGALLIEAGSSIRRLRSSRLRTGCNSRKTGYRCTRTISRWTTSLRPTR